jgi:hypothetical protein
VKERDHLGDVSVDGNINIKLNIKEYNVIELSRLDSSGSYRI